MKKAVILILIVSVLTGWESVAQSITPKGRIETFLFNESNIYPGTMREVVVYIPAQINADIPACVYVQQDGIRPNSAEVLDSLIAGQIIPVTVGVFVRPGEVPPPDTTTLARPNRGYEYDGLGDSYARFILDEILPYVANKYGLNLSKSGNDRAIGGNSSGGIAAFNAAWELPTEFTRVYCTSPSFVAFRGGHQFPTLVRKTEAKPIRAYMRTATNDMENSAGNWYLLDLEMEKALKFSGYEYNFEVLNGKHGAGFKECFAEALSYLWKDWPRPVAKGKSAPRVRDIILPNEIWEPVASDFLDIKGAASNSKGEVFFADARQNKIYKISVDGTVRVWTENAGYCRSLSFGANDELFTLSERTGKITVYDDTNTLDKKRVYAKVKNAYSLLAIRDGGLYVSCAPSENRTEKLLYIDSRGKETHLGSSIKFPSGIAMSPDKWLLAVADKYSNRIYSYTISPNHIIENEEPFFWLHTPDKADNCEIKSVCYDREGHLYAATNYGLQICAWNGPTQVILPLPESEALTALCIGGEEQNILFAFCKDKIYSRKIKTHAVGAFTEPVKMTKGAL